MTAVDNDEMRAELLDARRQLLLATLHQSRAIEAWARLPAHRLSRGRPWSSPEPVCR